MTSSGRCGRGFPIRPPGPSTGRRSSPLRAVTSPSPSSTPRSGCAAMTSIGSSAPRASARRCSWPLSSAGSIERACHSTAKPGSCSSRWSPTRTTVPPMPSTPRWGTRASRTSRTGPGCANSRRRRDSGAAIGSRRPIWPASSTGSRRTSPGHIARTRSGCWRTSPRSSAGASRRRWATDGRSGSRAVGARPGRSTPAAQSLIRPRCWCIEVASASLWPCSRPSRPGTEGGFAAIEGITERLLGPPPPWRRGWPAI